MYPPAQLNIEYKEIKRYLAPPGLAFYLSIFRYFDISVTPGSLSRSYPALWRVKPFTAKTRARVSGRLYLR